ALKNLAGNAHRIDDRRQAGSREYQRRSASGSVGGTAHRDAAISLLKRWCVIDAVPSHRDDMTSALQGLNYLILMLRKNSGKPIGALDGIHNRTAQSDRFIRVRSEDVTRDE